MKISDFAIEVTKLEGKKKQVNIAQVKEILKVINELTRGEFYKMLRQTVYIATPSQEEELQKEFEAWDAASDVYKNSATGEGANEIMRGIKEAHGYKNLKRT